MSDNRPETVIDDKRCKKYKATSFESAFPNNKKQDTDFVSIQVDEEKMPIFAPFQIYQGDKDGKQIINEIIEKAREQAASIEKDAYEKGFEQGEKDGLELGEEKAKKIVGTIEDLLNEIRSVKEEMIRRYEKEILEVIFSVVKKIIHVQTGFDNEIVRDTIMNAVAYATQKNEINLKINPDDFDYVESLRPEFFAEFKDLKSMMVTTDASITRGGCLIESCHGNIDAMIDTQIEKIKQCLESVFLEKKDA